MNHPATPCQLALTGEMDFIVPLKQVGLITRAVLEAIYEFHHPRRIIIVTARNEATILNKLVRFWNVRNVSTVDEELFFVPNFGLTLDDITRVYGHDLVGDKREAGWWLQQLIKLGASTQIKDLSEVYVVWDGETIFFVQRYARLF
jgi:hypothetical protein